jgi:hypothetical protein
MKAKYLAILVFSAAALLFTTVSYSRAAEDANKNEDNIWLEDTMKLGHGQFELTKEKIEHIMDRLAETDPNKAEQLKQLQEKDPEKFKTELREAMREQFGKKFKEHMKNPPEPFGPGGMPPGTCNAPPVPCPNNMPPGMGTQKHGEPFGPGHVMPEMGMRWRYDKYLEWLKENYAVEAEKLAEMSKKDPEIYWKHLGFSLKKYGKIAEAARENPRLAEVLKKDLELRQQQDKLLEEIEAAGDKDKEGLVKDLKDVINNRFDVIVERKQIEYEQLIEKLETLKKDVEQRKAKMEKWKDAKFKDDSVKARLEELLGKSDKFTW